MIRPHVGWPRNRLFRFPAGPKILLGSTVSLLWGQPSPLFESTGYALLWWGKPSGVEVVMTRLRMSAALPLCPLCAFMGWTRTAFALLTLLIWVPYSSSNEVDVGAWEKLINERLVIFIKGSGLWRNVGLCNVTVSVSHVSSRCNFHIFMKVTAVVSESRKVNGRNMTYE